MGDFGKPLARLIVLSEIPFDPFFFGNMHSNLGMVTFGLGHDVPTSDSLGKKELFLVSTNLKPCIQSSC